MSAAFPIVCVVLLGAFMFATFYGWLGRLTSALLFAAISALFLISVSESIGKPKPLWSEVHSLDQAIVLSVQPIYGEAIYLWVLRDGASLPTAYVLPWDMKTAQRLQDASREAEENNSHVVMEGPAGDGEDDSPDGTFEFHAAPQKKTPDKNYSQQ